MKGDRLTPAPIHREVSPGGWRAIWDATAPQAKGGARIQVDTRGVAADDYVFPATRRARRKR